MAAETDSVQSRSSSVPLDDSKFPSTTSTPPTEIETENEPLLKPSPSTPPRTLLKDFVHLTSNISLYIPPAGTPPAPASHPTTILFCAWMNAAAKHIDYYTRAYRALYPSTRIIVIRISTVQFLFTRESVRRKEIEPAVSALLAFEAENGVENERLVAHEISNGGAKRLYGVAALYLEKTGRPLPARSFLCDCAPGIPGFKRDIYAITLPFRKMNPLLATPLYVGVFLTACVVYACVHWAPRERVWAELVWRPTRLFNDGGFFWKRAARGYVYSAEDLSIDYTHVEAHADVAEEKGYKVFRKKIEGAGHALLWKGKGGEKDYWGWIKRLHEVGFGLRESVDE